MRKIPSFLVLTLLCSVAVLSTGCLTYKQMVNFQDGSQLDQIVDSVAKVNQVHIRPDDMLAINIYSYNLEEAARFNTMTSQQLTQITNGAGSGGVSDPIGYRVDSKGYIQMPVLGKVHVEGLTIEEIRDLVSRMVEATGYLKEHVVQVVYLSFRITVLGEVNNPGTFTLPSKKVSILEALGQAKDLTIFSNRDNILVIREQGGVREYGRVNIETKDVFKNPYYYLQPNDVVYVEPHKSKVLSAPDPVSRYIGILAGLISLTTLIITLSKN